MPTPLIGFYLIFVQLCFFFWSLFCVRVRRLDVNSLSQKDVFGAAGWLEQVAIEATSPPVVAAGSTPRIGRFGPNKLPSGVPGDQYAALWSSIVFSELFSITCVLFNN